jgi:4-diphosphocytidyl-2-C-methyl-D-erythritol kinase
MEVSRSADLAGLEWLPAPGKLNLFLHVLGRRADGYHELQTVFRLIERADRVGLRVRADGAIRRIAGPEAIAPEEDLCVRAARLLRDESGTPLGADIALEKNLPVGGGLGGGSSDAATVLLGLNRAWNLGLARARLMELAVRLGADAPLFVHGENALGEGIGERLRRLDLAPAWYLVLVPQVAVSTREIYSDHSLTRNSKRLKIPPFLSGQGRNDLEAIAVRRHPEIAQHLAWLRQREPQARMTGSGSCVFAELAGRRQAEALLAELPAAMRGFVTRGLDRHPLHDWAR